MQNGFIFPQGLGWQIPNIFELPAPTWNPNDLYFLKVNPPKNKAFSKENKGHQRVPG